MYCYRIIAAFLLGIGAGYGLWSYYMTRNTKTQYIQEELLFLTRMRSAVSNKAAMPEVLLYAARGTSIEDKARQIFSIMQQTPSADLEQLWKMLWNEISLPAQENEKMQKLIAMLNMKDPVMQLQIIDQYIQRVEKLISEAEEAWRKQKGVYVKLSTMAGLLIMIVFL